MRRAVVEGFFGQLVEGFGWIGSYKGYSGGLGTIRRPSSYI